MPSFLSKVFGRKKDSPDKETHSPVENRASTPLDGKFESVSPSATKFPEAVNGKSESKDKDRDPSPLSLFKPKSRQPPAAQKRVHAPHLSLNFPTLGDVTNSPSLGVVFEVDPDTLEPLADSVIGQRQLNQAETLSLVQTCSKAIKDRGLESLGIMHPQWHSASPESQRKLLTLFIHSLATSSSPTSPSPSAYATAFENEVSSSRSPHDVAAVLRWGLRHMQLEGGRFGTSDQWYSNFSSKERLSNYPPNAFSTILPPELPVTHLQLLKTVLELVSYLGAHFEANGSSGSKLSKFFGLWLLEAEQARNDDTWDAFYARWERAGRILEHLFLARVRDEGASSRLPTRLVELINKYPYGGSSPETGLLPRPRFSTYRHDALFVRVETEYTSSNAPKHHPFRLLVDAFKGETTAEGDHVDVWELIKKAGNDESQPSPGGYAGVGRVFADDTIRLLSRVPSASTDAQNPFIRATSPSARRRSFSVGDSDGATPTSPVRAKSPVSPTSPSKIQDWGDFMSSGFATDENAEADTSLAATLIKTDLEPSKHLSKGARNGHARKSLDTPRILPSLVEEQVDEASFVSKSTSVHMIQLDEAFIDFWSDALLDSVSSNWPGFVICKLKPTLSGIDVNGKRIEWLVIERQYKRPVPVSHSVDSEHLTVESASRLRPASPRSFKSDMSITTSLKRLSFLGGSFSGKSNKMIGGKKGGYKTGEMGEALVEEEEEGSEKKATPAEKSKSRTSLAIPKIKVPSPKSKKSVEIAPKAAEKPAEPKAEAATNGSTVAAAATGGATAVVAGVVAAAATSAAADDTPLPAEQATQSEVDAVPAAEAEQVVAEVKPTVEEVVPAPEAVAETTVTTKEADVPIAIANGHSTAVHEETKPAPAEETPIPAAEPVVPEETPTPPAEEPKAEVVEPVVDVVDVPESTPATADVEVPATVEERAPTPVAAAPEAAAPVAPTPAPAAVPEVPAPVAVPNEDVKEEEEVVPVTVVEDVRESDVIATSAPVEPVVEAEVAPTSAEEDKEEPTAPIVAVHEDVPAAAASEPSTVVEPVVSVEEALEKTPEPVNVEDVAAPAEAAAPEVVVPQTQPSLQAEAPVAAVDTAIEPEAVSDSITPESTPDVPPEVTQVLESSPHSEPLAVPEYTPGDNQVDLPAVPVVDAVPEYPLQELVAAVVPTPEPLQTTRDDEVELPVETVLAHGDTPGPQALLDHVEDAETKEDEAPKPAETEQQAAAPSEEEKVAEPAQAAEETPAAAAPDVEVAKETDEAKPSTDA